MHCQTISCPARHCPNPMPMQGQCCPVCPKNCQYMNLTYDDGEQFTPVSATCDDCLCRHSVVRCKRRTCPRLYCDRRRHGQCCPVCDDGMCASVATCVATCDATCDSTCDAACVLTLCGLYIVHCFEFSECSNTGWRS